MEHVSANNENVCPRRIKGSSSQLRFKSSILRTMGTTFRRLCTLLGLLHYGAAAASLAGDWTLVQQGTTGVSALELAVVSETKALILDKVEHNALMVDDHPAWGVELDINTQEVRALNPQSNTWCATGGFLSNGTLISTGGSPIQLGIGQDGLQALRLFTPCTDGTCDILEFPTRIRTTSPRWYPSSVRIEDGSSLIFGGSINITFANNATINNPTYEFFPPKNINGFNGLQIFSQFMNDTLNANQFPNMVYLPDGRVFVSANTQAMIFDWKSNTERRLPGIPNGVRISSPFSAGHVLLPLSAENNFTAEILICGGSTVSDLVSPMTLTPQEPTSSQCIRMAMDEDGIAKGWEVDQLPEDRIMGDMILLPDGRVLIVNGAMTGVAGYSSASDKIGQSNADNPAFMPVIYDPAAPPRQSLLKGRAYRVDHPTHVPQYSVLDAKWNHHARCVWILDISFFSCLLCGADPYAVPAGSNPNADVSTIKYATEYRLEFLSPPYMAVERPSYTGLPATFDFKSRITLDVELPDGTNDVKVALMDLGFSTHGVHMDQRLLYLDAVLSSDKTKLTVTGPPAPRAVPTWPRLPLRGHGSRGPKLWASDACWDGCIAAG
ncbi:Copper radical oxidase [Mycena sanguinolenta]|uniref:Copper radical oxidase n=1 Tax=Mycena sanguinolenta TaxID=230812 RepID=A0A8H7DCY6_9AGAR|nr:Copper radical oxidase [Mycena sanguinolenta]